MSNYESIYLEVALPVPLLRSFDYLPPADLGLNWLPGVRVRVPFGRRKLVGLVVAVKSITAVPLGKLKPVEAVLDHEPLFSPDMLELFKFASRYYLHPLGEVIATAMPNWLRAGREVNAMLGVHVKITDLGRSALKQGLVGPAKKQQALLEHLLTFGSVLPKDLKQVGFSRSIIRALEKKAWLELEPRSIKVFDQKNLLREPALSLNAEQEQALSIIQKASGFQAYVLEGVTGSGKTEVYMQAIAECLANKRQALVLIPEISLTPQTLARFRQRFRVPVACLHSRLNQGERAKEWLRACHGEVGIVIGTRSAVFVPMQQLGLIVMDEAHDSSFCQQSGFRYSARAMAVMRAKIACCPVVLGSATPSLQTLANVARGRYVHLELTSRATGQAMPDCRFIDLREQSLQAGLADASIAAINKHLTAGHQVMVFINRRGYAPVLLCHHCGFAMDCPHCDRHLTWHQSTHRLLCHHCGYTTLQPKQCPSCQQADLVAMGVGTEQLELILTDLFPDYRVLRFDRDTTQKKAALERMIAAVNEREVDILVGTQMLAKGHHFARLMLVVVVDIDSSLYSSDLDSMERLGQLLLQVAGRAGRDSGRGEVLIQTHQSHHPLLNMLLSKGYPAFAQHLLAEKKQAGLPPYVHFARFVVEADHQATAVKWLEELASVLLVARSDDVQVIGPMPSIMEKLAGRYHVELVLLSHQRKGLHKILETGYHALSVKSVASRTKWYLELAS